MTPTKEIPRAVSFCMVQVETRERTSISPDWSAVKRCFDESGTKLTFVPSPKIAAATARQKSASRPVQLPWLSADEKPARPCVTPQFSVPLAFTSSTVEAFTGMADKEKIARTNEIMLRWLGQSVIPGSHIRDLFHNTLAAQNDQGRPRYKRQSRGARSILDDLSCCFP